MASAMQDQEDAARGEVQQHVIGCRKAKSGYEQQEARLLRSRSDVQLKRANAMAKLNSDREEVRMKREELVQANEDLHSAKESCKSNLCEYEDRLQSLRELRADAVSHIGGTAAGDIRDCAVSEWIPGPCSATCGGGTQQLTRHVVVAAGEKGAPCPALTESRSCNSRPCASDCKVSSWSEWSSCSAECGGGTRTRSRRVLEQERDGGEPCPEENIVSTECNQQSCDMTDCVTGEWSQWSQCSRACGGGLRQRVRSIQAAQEGAEQFCPELDEDRRVEYLHCNNETCPETAAGSLRCKTKLDVAIVLDGSGGCGPTGFAESKTLVEALVTALDVGANKAQVSIIVAGGTGNFETYKKCIAGGSLADCNLKIELPLSPDAGAATATLSAMAWPGAPAHLGGALALAGASLSQQGRREAEPLVVVVTRGRPLSASRTLTAAKALQKTARVVWVLIGEDAPKEEAAAWASQPTRDNVLQLTSPPGAAPGMGATSGIAAPERVSEVIRAVCSKVGPA